MRGGDQQLRLATPHSSFLARAFPNSGDHRARSFYFRGNTEYYSIIYLINTITAVALITIDIAQSLSLANAEDSPKL